MAVGLSLAAFACDAVAQPITFRCSFPQVFNLQDGLSTQDFSFTLAYDSVTKTAALIGNVGVSALVVHAGFLAVSFMELVDSGVVQTLTLLPSGKAVYSRHTLDVGAGSFFASQQYGTCTPS